MANLETILVVGGGAAGLTAVAALHRHGFTTELVEQEQTWHTLGAGFLVHANGMRMLRSLGLAAGVENAGAAFAEGAFAISTAPCCRKRISKRCGATRVPALGLNGPNYNARCCQVSPMCAAGSARRSYPWHKTVVASRSGSPMARPETTISW